MDLVETGWIAIVQHQSWQTRQWKLASQSCLQQTRWFKARWTPKERKGLAQLEDAIAVYRHLLETMPGTDIILAGDSAGGGIAAAMMHKLQDLTDALLGLAGPRSLGMSHVSPCVQQELELPPPTCCILISPWTDLGHDGMRNATLSNEDCDFLPEARRSFRRRKHSARPAAAPEAPGPGGVLRFDDSRRFAPQRLATLASFCTSSAGQDPSCSRRLRRGWPPYGGAPRIISRHLNG